jgi:hypothetical protein
VPWMTLANDEDRRAHLTQPTISWLVYSRRSATSELHAQLDFGPCIQCAGWVKLWTGPGQDLATGGQFRGCAKFLTDSACLGLRGFCLAARRGQSPCRTGSLRRLDLTRTSNERSPPQHQSRWGGIRSQGTQNGYRNQIKALFCTALGQVWSGKLWRWLRMAYGMSVTTSDFSPPSDPGLVP